MKIIGC